MRDRDVYGPHKEGGLVDNQTTVRDSSAYSPEMARLRSLVSGVFEFIRATPEQREKAQAYFRAAGEESITIMDK